MQQLSGVDDRGMLMINQDCSRSKLATHLPSSYTIVLPAAIETTDFTTPAVQGPVKPSSMMAMVAATKDE